VVVETVPLPGGVRGGFLKAVGSRKKGRMGERGKSEVRYEILDMRLRIFFNFRH